MITVKQMRKLERFAHSKGILPIHLMENAGKQIYETVKRKSSMQDKHVAIFAGHGNNGGDGLAAAHHFSKEVPTVVFFFGDEKKLTEEAHEQYEAIKDLVNIIHVSSEEDLKQFHFNDVSLLCIDALLGIGMQGEIRPPIDLAITYYNSLKGEKISVDIPSGMNGDTGEGEIICNSDAVITFHDLKTGMESIREKTTIVDIGIPQLPVP